MKTKVEISLKNDKKISCAKDDYYGFFTRPHTWEDAIAKFKRLSLPVIDEPGQEKIIRIVRDLENQTMTTLLNELAVKL